MRTGKPGGEYKTIAKYMSLGLSFGLTMAITVYFLYRGGQWLDDRLGTGPLFMFLGVILGIVTVFKRLYNELQISDRMSAFQDKDLPEAGHKIENKNNENKENSS